MLKEDAPMKYKYEIDLKSVGSHIKTARSAAGYNKKEFAEYMGIEQKYLRDVERGGACPSFPLMVAISDKLNVSMNYLTKGSDDTTQDTKIPWETMYYVPEAEGFNERQYRTILKVIRFMAESLKEDKLIE